MQFTFAGLTVATQSSQVDVVADVDNVVGRLTQTSINGKLGFTVTSTPVATSSFALSCDPDPPKTRVSLRVCLRGAQSGCKYTHESHHILVASWYMEVRRPGALLECYLSTNLQNIPAPLLATPGLPQLATGGVVFGMQSGEMFANLNMQLHGQLGVKLNTTFYDGASVDDASCAGGARRLTGEFTRTISPVPVIQLNGTMVFTNTLATKPGSFSRARDPATMVDWFTLNANVRSGNYDVLGNLAVQGTTTANGDAGRDLWVRAPCPH